MPLDAETKAQLNEYVDEKESQALQGLGEVIVRNDGVPAADLTQKDAAELHAARLAGLEAALTRDAIEKNS